MEHGDGEKHIILQISVEKWKCRFWGREFQCLQMVRLSIFFWGRSANSIGEDCSFSSSSSSSRSDPQAKSLLTPLRFCDVGTLRMSECWAEAALIVIDIDLLGQVHQSEKMNSTKNFTVKQKNN